MANQSLIVIKFGGEIVESPTHLENLTTSVSQLHKNGNKVILVHGGGPLASKLSERMNLVPNMVGGRRVTCAETLEVMKMTLPGIINSNVLAIFKKFKIPAASVSGISFINATKRPPKTVSGSDGKKVDFGYVGDVINIDTSILDCLLEKNFIPIVNPLSCDSNGQILNINADTIAVHIAKNIKAELMVSITKIGGVFEDINKPETKFKALSLNEAKEKINEGIIQGGMIPKLEEGFALLEGHLNSFHIVATDDPDTLLKEIETPGSRGTAIVK